MSKNQKRDANRPAKRKRLMAQAAWAYRFAAQLLIAPDTFRSEAARAKARDWLLDVLSATAEGRTTSVGLIDEVVGPAERPAARPAVGPLPAAPRRPATARVAATRRVAASGGAATGPGTAAAPGVAAARRVASGARSKPSVAPN